MYKRYDKLFDKEVVTIFPGELHVCRTGCIVQTVLGSCISVCLSDKVNNIHGMNHFMLPMNSRSIVDIDSKIKDPKNFYSEELRYGTVSMEVLIGEMQKAGAARQHLQAKVFGGGKVLRIHSNRIDVGEKNIKFALAYLHMEKIPVVNKNLGENFGRKIYFVTEKDKVFLKRLPTPVYDIDREEEAYNKKLATTDKAGSVDLF